jgi:hypothetical protein
MRDAIIQHVSSVRPPKSLAVRGGLARTFGGLAGFVVVTFLSGGFYILQDAFANPLTEGAAALIAAAFIIALAAVLLFFLIKPITRPRATRQAGSVDDAAAPAARPIFKPAPRAARPEPLRSNLAYQRFYVDRSCIRP